MSLKSASLYLIVSILCACNRYIPDCEHRYWRFQKTCTGCHFYDSARIYLPPNSPCQSIEIELMRGACGERLYVTTQCFQLTPLDSEESEVAVSFRSVGEERIFEGTAFKGGQRLLMEEAAQTYLIKQMHSGHEVEIRVGIFHACIPPTRFSSNYSKMQKAVL